MTQDVCDNALQLARLLSLFKHLGAYQPTETTIHVYFTRAGPVLRNFRGRPGGGGLDAPPPSKSAPRRRSEKRQKSVRKLVKSHFETISVNFSLRSILRSPEVIKGQMTQMVFR